MENKEVNSIQRLNELLILVKVNAVGYQETSARSKALDFKVYFDRKLYAYSEFVDELENELIFLEMLDEKICKCPHFFKTKWKTFNWDFKKECDKTNLKITIEAEKKLTQEYSSTLQLDLKSSTKTLLELQRDYININLHNYMTLL